MMTIDDVRIEGKFHLSLSLVYFSMCEISGLSRGKKNDLSLISMSIIRECVQSPIQVGDIARMNMVSYGTATECVINLERKGYIRRVKGKDDGRAVYVIPTEKALAWVADIEKKVHGYVDKGMSRLNDHEQKQLIDLLARFCGVTDDMSIGDSVSRVWKEDKKGQQNKPAQE